VSQAIWRSWNPEAVIQAVADELVANGEIAGKFVESDARRRLLAVRTPEWGAAYRAIIANYMLTSYVEREPKAVVIWVGVRRGEKGVQHGLWIELGTRSRTVVTKAGKKRRIAGYPAHPYLRPAVFENAREIVQLLAGK